MAVNLFSFLPQISPQEQEDFEQDWLEFTSSDDSDSIFGDETKIQTDFLERELAKSPENNPVLTSASVNLNNSMENAEDNVTTMLAGNGVVDDDHLDDLFSLTGGSTFDCVTPPPPVNTEMTVLTSTNLNDDDVTALFSFTPTNNPLAIPSSKTDKSISEIVDSDFDIAAVNVQPSSQTIDMMTDDARHSMTSNSVTSTTSSMNSNNRKRKLPRANVNYDDVDFDDGQDDDDDDNSSINSSNAPSSTTTRITAISSGPFPPKRTKRHGNPNSRMAQYAKQYRQQSKQKLTDLENTVRNLQEHKKSLLNQIDELGHVIRDQSEEIDYLRAVLATQSELAPILKRVVGEKGQKIQMDFDEPTTTPKRRDAARNAKQPKVAANPGVCVHVDKNGVSIEFCGRCANSRRSVV